MSKITICLYSKVTEDGNGYNEAVFNEQANVEKIKREIQNTAARNNQTAPEIEISLLLLPKPGQTYNSLEYKAVQQQLMSKAQDVFGTSGKVVDSYSKLSDGEKEYLAGLESVGSAIDLVKHRAIIDNGEKMHLQMDSNTTISNWDALYERTFGQKEPMQDIFNASRCSVVYIATHNKIVFTVPTSKGGL